MNIFDFRDTLITRISSDTRIMGIGQTGSLTEELVPGKSDIDLFVLCTQIPSKKERQAFYDSMKMHDFSLQMEVCSGGQWGYGDILTMDGIDVMPMYFTIAEMRNYLTEVLECRHLEKDGRFYPVGRLASICAIHILQEKEEAWTSLKNMVNEKPRSFFEAWFQNEIMQVIDEEDLGRCELRKDVIFYHQVLENALDHLLQALYAVNRTYFPSRKRTMSMIDSFQKKPKQCYDRLIAMIQNGSHEDTMMKSIEDLRVMAEDLRVMAEEIQAENVG